MTNPLFSSLPLAPALISNLDNLGYTHMTPIQAASLPIMLEQRDLIAQAKTGSGKTAADDAKSNSCRRQLLVLEIGIVFHVKF